MEIRVCLIAFYFFIQLPQAFSQILNIEQFRPDKDTANWWSGNVGFGLSTKKQINNVVTTSGDGNVVYMTARSYFMSINHLNLVTASGAKIVSEGYTHLRMNFYRKNFISYEPFLQLQYDLGRGLDIRRLVGFTFRSDLRSVEKFVLGFNSGVMYEHEVWKGQVLRFASDTSNTRAETKFLKSTSNISMKILLGKNVSFFALAYYQARFNHFFKPRLISDFQFKFTITKHLSLALELSSTFDALPIINNNSLIYTFSNNLVLKF